MKNYIVLSALTIGLLTSSCVSKKKYVQLQTEHDNTKSTLVKTKLENEELKAKVNTIEERVEAYNEKINSLRDESDLKYEEVDGVAVISAKQKENLREYLKRVDQDRLAKAETLQDSMNLAIEYKMTNTLQSSNFAGNEDDIDINIDETVVLINISDKLLFGSGSTRISNDADSLLERLAVVLNSEPSLELMVEGHTDDTSIVKDSYLKDNWELSAKRATAIVRRLQDKYNVDPSRMIVAGRSSYKPLVPNTTTENKAINRRTRILILPNLDKFFALMQDEI